jgi:dTDP-4-dehydrorhamnose 3,5-epimerase
VIFEATPILGAYVVKLERHADDRGFFARTFCVDEFTSAGLVTAEFVQQSLARNMRRGILRGMHLQIAPHAEAKYIRCVRGSIFDAIFDVRPDSASYRTSFAIELNAENGDALFIPPGCAHGYQALQDGTDVLYAMSSRYAPDAARSVRWDDPELSIAWPIRSPLLSGSDASAPLLREFLVETYGLEQV